MQVFIFHFPLIFCIAAFSARARCALPVEEHPIGLLPPRGVKSGGLKVLRKQTESVSHKTSQSEGLFPLFHRSLWFGCDLWLKRTALRGCLVLGRRLRNAEMVRG